MYRHNSTSDIIVTAILICTTIFASSCERIFFEPEPENNPEALFESFWTTFNENYGAFEERHVNWQEQYDLYRSSVNAQTTDDELYEIFKLMITPLNDGHTNIFAEGFESFCSNLYFEHRIDDELFDFDLIKSDYLNNDFETGEEDSYYYGMIGDVIYIHFPYVYDNFHAIGKAIDEYEDAKGMIIDMRHNSGGDFSYAYSDMGRLVDEKRLAFYSKTKNGPGENDYTETYEWYVEPAGTYFDKTVVVLTDRYTISAGERAVMGLMTLPNVTLIGDTTNGAHSTMIGGELINGWSFTYPTQKIALFDGTSYEGIGLAPDMYLKNDPADMENGIDAVLDEALSRF